MGTNDCCAQCDACGRCLTHCPYISLDAGRSKREMKKLLQGRDSVLLERCVGCATCDAFCEKGCLPYTLIRARWTERYEQRGLPERARFLLPHSNPNFRSVIRLSAADRAYVRGLAAPPAGPRVLYAGCNALLVPHQLRSRLFSGLEIFGAADLCCGEMYYRMGLTSHARRCAERIADFFEHSPIEEMVFVCSACYNMFTNVYPREFGVTLNFKKKFAATYLLEQLDAGEFTVRRPLRKKITVQDTCHAKMMGGGFWDAPRELIRRLGGEVVESEHTRATALCCGVAAGCCRFNALDLFATAARRLTEFDGSGARVAAAYCNGCWLTLATVRRLWPSRTPVAPLWDLAMSAAGEDVPAAAKRDVTAQMLMGILFHAAPALLMPLRRFRLK